MDIRTMRYAKIHPIEPFYHPPEKSELLNQLAEIAIDLIHTMKNHPQAMGKIQRKKTAYYRHFNHTSTILDKFSRQNQSILSEDVSNLTSHIEADVALHLLLEKEPLTQKNAWTYFCNHFYDENETRPPSPDYAEIEEEHRPPSPSY